MRIQLRSPARKTWLVLACLITSFACALAVSAAFYTDAGTEDGNTFSAATLAAPATVTATSGSPASLSWSPVAKATGYKVFRAASAGGPYTEVTPGPSGTSTNWTDPSGNPGTWYYTVRTELNAWESPDSTNVSAVNCDGLVDGADPSASYTTTIDGGDPAASVAPACTTDGGTP